MTYLEVIWKDAVVVVTGIKSNRGIIHPYVRRYVGRSGTVISESKNNQLLIKFRINGRPRTRSIPPGCVSKLEEVRFSRLTESRKSKTITASKGTT